MSEFVIPGFPTEVSEHIDMPDIAELLMYPAFQGILAEDFMKHATEFQKFLFNKIPLRHDTKHVTVRSCVNILEPSFRSHVGSGRNAGWHIDGINDFDFREPSERVFILSSDCKALTEFNVNPIKVTDSPDHEKRGQFFNRLNNNLESFGVVGKTIEPNRIYTFENHLHRAVDPTRIEFRYFLRVRETNGTDVFSKKPLNKIFLTDGFTGKNYENVDYVQDKLVIHYPRSLNIGKNPAR
jgi:hypothetical protein